MENLIERSGGKPLVRIGDALPQVFERSYPVVQPTTDLLLAASLLRFHQIDALPIEFKATKKRRLAVFGYSCLSKLLETRPSDYKNFLNLPAKKAALQLSTVNVDAEISELLSVFQKTKFGFAWIESEKLGGFASLRDLLRLYESGIIETSLKLEDLASPIFSLSKDTAIKSVLEEMFGRRIRRIFVEGANSVVTDRRIIGHLFSPSWLEQVSMRPKELLDVKLSDLETFKPPKVRSSLSAANGARLMRDQIEECLVCEKGVITPWDLLMKPLSLDSLEIKD